MPAPRAATPSTCSAWATFIASARLLGRLSPGQAARELRLIDPNGKRVAGGRGSLRFDVGLRTLADSHDAQGRPRPWTLEVLASSAPAPQRRQSATVVAATRVRTSARRSAWTA